MSSEERDCPYASEDELPARYARGELDEARAEAFEEHFFACERCWSELRRALELRSAFSPQRAVASRRRARSGAYLAAAAVLALAVTGGLLFVRRMPSEPVFRAPGTAFVPDVRATAEGVTAVWPAYPRAASYVVEVHGAEGVRVLRQETTETRAEIASGALPAAEGRPFYLSIRALGPHGDVLASSEPVRLTPPAR
jgi:anti-sigma factor RsiW